MSKRLPKPLEPITKKPKLDVTFNETSSRENKKVNKNANTSSKNIGNNDLWEDIFLDDEQLEEIDFISSQACNDDLPGNKAQLSQSNQITANVSSLSGLNSHFTKIESSKELSQKPSINNILQSQVLGSSGLKKNIANTQEIIFDEFENKLMNDSHNSTFLPRQNLPENGLVLDSEHIEKWQEEKKKLLDDFMAKEGETEFLRQKINQLMMRSENDKKEKECLLEKEFQKHQTQIIEVRREKDTLKTQLELKELEISQLIDKIKVIESGSIKLAQPQSQLIKTSSKVNSTLSRSSSLKKVKTKESSVQVDKPKKANWKLKSDSISYPLSKIPKSIFEPTENEKSVIEIKIEEKIGKRNLPIIQEDSFRIFENPELTKPKITIVNKKSLSLDFVLSDIAQLMNKTYDEINSFQTLASIHKIVATARELLLNSTIVLQKVSQSLQNDDIRDMNELYLSEFYEMPVIHTKSLCQASPWYGEERGIETRRIISVLSHISKYSNYLAEYLAGKKQLKLDNDFKYLSYINQMNSYNNWHKKGIDFEFLDLISEFVNVVGLIRRSHQFSGLIISIINLIVNIKNNIGFCPVGMKKVLYIIKEIIFSRPLLVCFAPIANLLAEFSEIPEFVNQLCIKPVNPGLKYWKGTLSFTTNSCPLEIFISQLEAFKIDPITVIKITKSLAFFSHKALLTNSIPWLSQTLKTCNCCLNLLKFVIVNLCECSKINIENLKKQYLKIGVSCKTTKNELHNKKLKSSWDSKFSEDWNNLENDLKENFWNELKAAQFHAITYGIRLLRYLAKRDVDFTIRALIIENAFHQFIHNVNEMKDLSLQESDSIALEIIKKTFVFIKKEESESPKNLVDNINGINEEFWTEKFPKNLNLIKLYKEFM